LGVSGGGKADVLQKWGRAARFMLRAGEYLGARFRRWIREKYNWQKIAEQTIEVYQEL